MHDTSSPRTAPLSRRRTALRLSRSLGVPLLLAAVVTAGSPGWASYLIRPGDNLESIAKRYHTTVAKLIQVNGLPGNGNLIYAGRTLRVPAPAAPVTRTVTVNQRHRVVPGDSLIKIAHEYGVQPRVIVQANRLPRSLVVQLGQVLVVPVSKRVTTGGGGSFAGRSYAAPTVAAAARNRAALAGRDVPSRQQVRDLIVRIARRNGVDPNLALAVSWQEAGWNMRKVSVANAIGAMQIVPATGDWISSVVGRRLDLLNARDNITAGVVLLRILTHSTSEAKAVAGYYQGLRSVREHGMFPDTKAYVANVLALKKHFAHG
ncbi:MAG TPA: LysM peptidoglycan-binding domain-containing protein [Candidatus Eisenbacteria bacterium]|nr:LysM peptidoglycan-binding domain-containing protein [Candidatus Eisenbacteria bacterium]